MNKLWAKVRFKQDKNAEHLIKAFFKNFNPANSIVIRGKEAKMLIHFQNPPTEILNAIVYCDVIRLVYGNAQDFKEYESMQGKKFEQVGHEEKVSEQPKQQVEQEPKSADISGEDAEQPSEEDTPHEQPKQKNQEETGWTDLKLDELAKKAESFKAFAKLIAEELEMDKRQELFENLAIASTEIDKISWKNLNEVLDSKGISYTKWDLNWITQQVSNKLESVTILKLLRTISQYKDYPFNNREEKEEASEVVEQDSQEEMMVPEVKRIRLECMPEIQSFEEMLASIDKTQPIEKRVCCVLEFMGLNKKSAELRTWIIDMASTAMKIDKMTLELIFVNSNIPMENTMTVRMEFSKLISDFVQKYENGKKVKLLTFLSDLQKAIVFDSEIQSYSDFKN